MCLFSVVSALDARPPQRRGPPGIGPDVSARESAWNILRQWALIGAPPLLPERGEAHLQWDQLDARDRAFAFDLVTGVIRWRGLLDALIASRLRGRWSNSIRPCEHFCGLEPTNCRFRAAPPTMRRSVGHDGQKLHLNK